MFSSSWSCHRAKAKTNIIHRRPKFALYAIFCLRGISTRVRVEKCVRARKFFVGELCLSGSGHRDKTITGMDGEAPDSTP